MEEDPVLLADDRRHALLALTQLGRIALAEFARQQDLSKYQVYLVRKGKNQRPILRNPTTGTRMEIPPGYEVQEGKLVKSQQAPHAQVALPRAQEAKGSKQSPVDPHAGLVGQLLDLQRKAVQKGVSRDYLENQIKAAGLDKLKRSDVLTVASKLGIHTTSGTTREEAIKKIRGRILDVKEALEGADI